MTIGDNHVVDVFFRHIGKRQVGIDIVRHQDISVVPSIGQLAITFNITVIRFDGVVAAIADEILFRQFNRRQGVHRDGGGSAAFTLVAIHGIHRDGVLIRSFSTEHGGGTFRFCQYAVVVDRPSVGRTLLRIDRERLGAIQADGGVGQLQAGGRQGVDLDGSRGGVLTAVLVGTRNRDGISAGRLTRKGHRGARFIGEVFPSPLIGDSAARSQGLGAVQTERGIIQRDRRQSVEADFDRRFGRSASAGSRTRNHTLEGDGRSDVFCRVRTVGGIVDNLIAGIPLIGQRSNTTFCSHAHLIRAIRTDAAVFGLVGNGDVGIDVHLVEAGGECQGMAFVLGGTSEIGGLRQAGRCVGGVIGTGDIAPRSIVGGLLPQIGDLGAAGSVSGATNLAGVAAGADGLFSRNDCTSAEGLADGVGEHPGLLVVGTILVGVCEGLRCAAVLRRTTHNRDIVERVAAGIGHHRHHGRRERVRGDRVGETIHRLGVGAARNRDIVGNIHVDGLCNLGSVAALVGNRVGSGHHNRAGTRGEILVTDRQISVRGAVVADGKAEGILQFGDTFLGGITVSQVAATALHVMVGNGTRDDGNRLVGDGKGGVAVRLTALAVGDGDSDAVIAGSRNRCGLRNDGGAGGIRSHGAGPCVIICGRPAGNVGRDVEVFAIRAIRRSGETGDDRQGVHGDGHLIRARAAVRIGCLNGVGGGRRRSNLCAVQDGLTLFPDIGVTSSAASSFSGQSYLGANADFLLCGGGDGKFIRLTHLNRLTDHLTAVGVGGGNRVGSRSQARQVLISGGVFIGAAPRKDPRRLTTDDQVNLTTLVTITPQIRRRDSGDGRQGVSRAGVCGGSRATIRRRHNHRVGAVAVGCETVVALIAHYSIALLPSIRSNVIAGHESDVNLSAHTDSGRNICVNLHFGE